MASAARAVRSVPARAARRSCTSATRTCSRATRRSAGAIDTAANLAARRSTRSSAPASVPTRSSSRATSPISASPRRTRALRAAVEPVAARLGAPVVWVAGNHDERPALRRDLLDAEPTRRAGHRRVQDLGGLRLDRARHDRARLAPRRPRRRAARVAAPTSSPSRRRSARSSRCTTRRCPAHIPLFDILELRDQSRLAAVVAGTDVRAILAGHLHYSTSGTFAGVPVSVAAATCYTMNLQRPPARGQRHGCRAVVPPRARLRRHDHPRRRAGRRRRDGRVLHRRSGSSGWRRSRPPSASRRSRASPDADAARSPRRTARRQRCPRVRVRGCSRE